MRKKKLSIILSALLLSPIVIATQVRADEVSEKSTGADTELVGLPELVSTENPQINAQYEATSLESVKEVDAEKERPVEVDASKLTETDDTLGGLPKPLSVSETPEKLSSLIENPHVANQNLSIGETAVELLKWAEAKPDQTGATVEDRLEFAKSLGMIPDGVGKDGPVQNLNHMISIAKKLKEAYRAEKKAPLILNGKTQPIFPFTPGDVETGYSNEKSDIVRFVVYVESDYDTDGDGKRDLIKTFVQLPKAVANGDFKASTIYEASPYVAGTTNKETLGEIGLKEEGEFDNKKLYRYVDPRRQNGSTTTLAHAKKADSKDWYYKNPNESDETFTRYDYENINWYNYFLVRGYAVVTTSGLGSYQSEGINTTGSDLEVAGYKSVIEWLNGKRVAYTDKTSNIAIKADWSNGKVGMTGLSWAGTTTFGVAATGVEGLKTIVPAAGIASWYDYYNSQGTTFNVGHYRDLSHLSVYVSNRILDPADWNRIKEDYARYITQLNRDQHKHGYNYSDIWKNRDYTLHPEKFKASALVMHGLNDDNVRTKHFDLMYQTLKKAGQPVKLYLYQGDHIYPVNKRFGIKEGQQSVSDLLNIWFSHYLYDVENQVESLPEVTVSNNYDPSKWEHYSSWESSNQLTLKTLSRREEETIDNDYYGAGMDWTNRDSHTTKQSSTANALFAAEATEDVTIKGHIPVHFQAALAKLTNQEIKDYQVNVQLVDLSDEEFDVASNKITYDEAGYKYQEMPLNTLSESGYWMGSNLKNIANKQFGTIKTKYKVISSGWINLANPDAGYASASSSSSIDPKLGEFRNYTVYLQPNLYTVKKGHKLGLVFTTFDSNYVWTDDPYSYRLKTRSIVAEIPTVQKSSLRYAWYVPNEKDETYQVLPLVEEPLPEYPLDTLVPSVDQKEQIPNKEYKPYKSGSLAVESSKKDTLAPLAVNYQQETPETVDEELPQVSSTRKEGLYLPQTGMTTNFEVTSSVLGIVLLVGMGMIRLKEREN